MAALLEMPGRMLVPRLVAATDVAAGEAQSQMHPVVAGLQALFAPVTARRDVTDLGEMRAGVHRGRPCFYQSSMPHSINWSGRTAAKRDGWHRALRPRAGQGARSACRIPATPAESCSGHRSGTASS